jgi:hypothetical protein
MNKKPNSSVGGGLDKSRNNISNISNNFTQDENHKN